MGMRSTSTFLSSSLEAAASRSRQTRVGSFDPSVGGRVFTRSAFLLGPNTFLLSPGNITNEFRHVIYRVVIFTTRFRYNGKCNLVIVS